MFIIDGIDGIMKTKETGLGGALLMWFADDILAMLDISFVRPFNIQSNPFLSKYINANRIFKRSCHILRK